MIDVGANYITSIVAIGIGLAFVLSDWRSTNSRYFALFLVMFGITGAINTIYYRVPSVDALPAWHVLTGIPVGLCIIAVSEWLFRVRQTIPAGELRTDFGDWQLRLAQGFACLYAVITVIFHETRADQIMYQIGRPQAWSDPEFYLFAVPFSIPVLLVAFSTILTLNRKPDRPEFVRLLCLAIASPFLAAGFFVPPQYAPYLVIVGLMIFLTGAVEYQMIQAQRGAFMGRFLAPQVASLVRETGLETSLQDKAERISVVYCDLRGFTAYSEEHDSATVIGLLREYYEIVGDAAGRHEATIKDYAGDGVMLLVGAPVNCKDHAVKALRLAVEIRDRVGFLLQRYRNERHPLGVGVGVATGMVSVGVVGGSRLEYAAVGSTVNLSARLCDRAKSGEVLIDKYTRDDVDEQEPTGAWKIVTRGGAELKGWNLPIAHFAVNSG